MDGALMFEFKFTLLTAVHEVGLIVKWFKFCFKDILLYTNSGLSKIRSVQTYVLKGFILVVSTVKLD